MELGQQEWKDEAGQTPQVRDPPATISIVSQSSKRSARHSTAFGPEEGLAPLKMELRPFKLCRIYGKVGKPSGAVSESTPGRAQDSVKSAQIAVAEGLRAQLKSKVSSSCQRIVSLSHNPGPV